MCTTNPTVRIRGGVLVLEKTQPMYPPLINVRNNLCIVFGSFSDVENKWWFFSELPKRVFWASMMQCFHWFLSINLILISELSDWNIYSILFLFLGKEVMPTDNITIDSAHNESVLTVRSATRANSGPYVINLENRKGKMDVQITTVVLGK